MDKVTDMLDLPDNDTLYAALLARDPAWEGRALVGVTTTGIFCRLTCPARKPLPQNCRWFASPDAAQAAGFRPCRRCHPLGATADGEPLVRDLLARLDKRPDRRWSEADLLALGHDPSTVRRAFKRHFGQSFRRTRQLYARYSRAIDLPGDRIQPERASQGDEHNDRDDRRQR